MRERQAKEREREGFPFFPDHAPLFCVLRERPAEAAESKELFLCALCIKKMLALLQYTYFY
jgi:hypothetical protein